MLAAAPLNVFATELDKFGVSGHIDTDYHVPSAVPGSNLG